MSRIRLSLGLATLVGLASASIADDVAPPESFSAEQKAHWAFRPVARTEPPRVEDSAWIRNPIDRFIRAATEELGLAHVPPADRVALLRRVTYDLTGLPPSPEEVASFLGDGRPDAYERVVDRLLASPAYGERWAQHWLDLAHYADSNGFEMDADRPDAWRYRDWVVNALNDDMPYDRFVTLQVAGDEAEPGSTSALIASGFGRCGPREVVSGNIDPEVRRQSELTEITSTVGSVFLGLTMGCARCHDHKFDPLPTTDFYRLQSFFANAEMKDQPIASEAETKAFAEAERRVKGLTAPLEARKKGLETPYQDRLRAEKEARLTDAERAVLAISKDQRTPAQKKLAQGTSKALEVHWEEIAAAVARNPDDHEAREALKAEIEAARRTLPRPPAHAMALIDDGQGVPETFVLRRGDVKTRGPKVAPRPPGIALMAQPDDAYAPAESPRRRLALARWMTRADNPLTARVIVNRLWMHHFGRGIVATPSDFGARGESPSHPELLDWLASELVAGGWTLKPMHRIMVTSATYRQASRVDREASAKARADDPDNAYLWKMNRRRMDAEALRDAMLFASGELNLKAGGPGVLPPIEPEVEDLIFTEAELVDKWPETPDPSEHVRRSLYLFRKRNVRYPMFDAFDAPDTQTACPQRGASLHALQPLVTLNSRFALDRATALADRVDREAGPSDQARVDRLYRLVLARDPSAGERATAIAFLSSQAAFLAASLDPHKAARVDLALAMLNRSEFVFLP